MCNIFKHETLPGIALRKHVGQDGNLAMMIELMVSMKLAKVMFLVGTEMDYISNHVGAQG